jgi:uncharacterized protein (DUF488 family)
LTDEALQRKPEAGDEMDEGFREEMAQGGRETAGGPMATGRASLTTIGYESADLSDFIVTLRRAGVNCLIDVRELPISRRKGFAKRALSEALADAGIGYVHLRGLGDPKEGRDAARAGDVAGFTRVFTKHMKSTIAQCDLQKAVRLVGLGGACLMCYERDHSACHRSIVAEAISDISGVAIFHLRVSKEVGRHRHRHEQLKLAAEATA